MSAPAAAPPLLEARGVAKRFPLRGGRGAVHAVDGVSLELARGECVGLVGESGCGKSTLARILTRLLDPSEGEIRFDGRDIGAVSAARFARAPERARIQMVFQDPADSLNPRHTAFHTIAEPLRRLGAVGRGAPLRARVAEVAELVGLADELLGRYPHQLSGGQQQRVAIGRAIALDPALLVLDEPTSALDVSVQAVVLRLLADVRRRLGMTYLFVSHDLNVVQLFCERVLVMYLGKIVEAGPARQVFARPRHPYTRALVSAIPVPDPRARLARLRLQGEPGSPVDPSATECRFLARCPERFERCAREMPALRVAGGERLVACHLDGE